jgi:RNA polymerase sigma-70 factor (ECF subfamily)
MADRPSEDRELLRQLAKGNEAAFTSLYERYQGPLYRFAWHMSGNPACAEEATQEAFLRLIGNPRKYDPDKGSVAGYLFGIARNVLRRQIGQDCAELPLSDEPTAEESAYLQEECDLLDRIDRRELLDCLRRSVLALPEAYREVVVLCDLQELSYPEAAAMLECRPGTVASRLHRARNLLKARLVGMGCVR